MLGLSQVTTFMLGLSQVRVGARFGSSHLRNRSPEVEVAKDPAVTVQTRGSRGVY
jgi:hypothetical protein